MAYDFQCTFDMDECIKTLGLNEKGKVQQYVTNEVLNLSEPYIPRNQGGLIASGHIENSTDIVWNTPYAHYMWGGIVYEDPVLHCAGFPVADGGWRSRKKVEKVPTERPLEYKDGTLRGSKWVERMLQDGGQREIEEGARKKVRK